MAYEFRYKLSKAPVATNDGSGVVSHDIWARASSDGENWEDVPGRHKTIQIPGDELQVVMDMANNGAKIAAYKDALVNNLNTLGTPLIGWSPTVLEELMLANDAAESVAAEADEYITITLGQSYPVEFSL